MDRLDKYIETKLKAKRDSEGNYIEFNLLTTLIDGEIYVVFDGDKDFDVLDPSPNLQKISFNVVGREVIG